jgi:maltose O-acetyltransferase
MNLQEARSYLADGMAVVRGRVFLRRATSLGSLVRLWGRPRVVNDGTLTIGDKVRLGSKAAPIELVAGPGGELVIGAKTFINFGSSIVAMQKIHIGADCQIGPYCMVMDNSYHHVEPERRNEPPESVPVMIGDNVWLGARAIVLPGVSIGSGSVIGAGSVVTNDIPERTFAAGVPARVIKSI